MSLKSEAKKSDVTVAIDIGTANSGCAFAWRDKPEMIISGLPNQPETAKVKTAFMLDEKNNVKFGDQAVKSYVSKHTPGRKLYDLFKMQLYNNGSKLSTRPSVVAVDGGNAIGVVDAFAYSFGHFRKELMTILDKQTNNKADQLTITWVITLPAIWSDAAKAIMMEAARKAGLVSDKSIVVVALEPECASLYVKATAPSQVDMKTGVQYLVVDAGGGTIDLAFHEVQADGTLKTISVPSGGNWGSAEVNKRFMKMLKDVFGNAMDAYQKERAQDYAEVLANFEQSKITNVGSAEDEDEEYIRVQVPEFHNFCEEKSFGTPADMVSRNGARYGLQWNSALRRLLLPTATVRNWFKEDIKQIVAHVKTVLTTTKHKAKQIFLVGGYAECNLLFNAMKEAFPYPQYNVARPPKPGVGIVVGAVMYGLNPPAIATRMTNVTYGAEVRERYSTVLHGESKRPKPDNFGDMWVDSVYSKFLQNNDTFAFDHTITRTFQAPSDTAESATINILAAKGCAPQFVTEPGCEKLGTIVVPMPMTDDQRRNWTAQQKKEREVVVTFKFGTVINVTAKDTTSGRQREIDVDYFRA